MGQLTFAEKLKLERALGMSGGYVLDFSNRTFAQFFTEVAGIDIYSPIYEIESGSKANRMRAFWNIAADSDILAILEGLHDLWDEYCGTSNDDDETVVLEVVSRLKGKVGSDLPQHNTLSRIENIQFSVALSFSGKHRSYVEAVAKRLKSRLGVDQVFYDKDYQAQLARPDLDTLLQNIYRNASSLVVVFLCSNYADSEWCGLEWRAVRDIIKSKNPNQIMFIRFNDGEVDGAFSIDGHIDATSHDELSVADFIFQRSVLNQGMKPALESPEINSSSSIDFERVKDVKEALQMLQQETKFLWLAILEINSTESSCSAEVKNSTLNRIDPAIKLLATEGHFSFRRIHSYEMETPQENVFKVILEHVSPQLVNLARNIEAADPRPI